jgi:hypothetical protein
MVLWLFRGPKGLLHSAAEKARHAELAFKESSRAMDGTWHALLDLHHRIPANAGRQVPRDIYKTMRRVERHSKILLRRTRELKYHIEQLDKQAKAAGAQRQHN